MKNRIRHGAKLDFKGYRLGPQLLIWGRDHLDFARKSPRWPELLGVMSESFKNFCTLETAS